MINQSMGSKDWAMLLLLSLLWGGSFFFIGVAVTELPPLTIVTLRVGIAAITLWIVLLAAGYEVPKTLRLWRTFFIMGLSQQRYSLCSDRLGSNAYRCGISLHN